MDLSDSMNENDSFFLKCDSHPRQQSSAKEEQLLALDRSKGIDFGAEVIQLFLHVLVLSFHVLVLLLPRFDLVLKCLDLAFEVTGLDVGLTKPSKNISRDWKSAKSRLASRWSL